MWNGELEICITVWWADENQVSDTTTWRCHEHNRDRMVTFETHLNIEHSCEMATKCNISWDCRRTLFWNILNGFWVYFMWRWILLGYSYNLTIMGILSAETRVLYNCLIHAMRLWVNTRHQPPQGQPTRKTGSPVQNKIHKALLIIGPRLPKAMGR